jgi:hypothetical protein
VSKTLGPAEVSETLEDMIREYRALQEAAADLAARKEAKGKAIMELLKRRKVTEAVVSIPGGSIVAARKPRINRFYRAVPAFAAMVAKAGVEVLCSAAQVDVAIKAGRLSAKTLAQWAVAKRTYYIDVREVKAKEVVAK